MGLRSTLAAWLTPLPAQDERSFWPFVNFNGNSYAINPFQQTLIGPEEKVAGDFSGLAGGAYAGNGVVFSCLNARMALFTQARPMWRRLRSGTPGELWSNRELEILRTPWPNGTTADLLARMIQDADLGGNAFIARVAEGRLARLRPDWVTIVHGGSDSPWAPDAEVIGYIYQPGGPGSGARAVPYGREQVAHFAPIPDPMFPTRGMSWLTPLIREIEADSAATTHKLMFFRNGATPNMIITGVVPASGQSLQDWVDLYRKRNEGVENAYRTQFFSAGTEAKVVGADLQQIDFKVTQGAGETRIAAAAGVPPVVVGLSEGMQGSSLNAGNFNSAMRRFADLTGRPLWANVFGSLSAIVPVPGDSELFYDDRYIPALKDDITDAAEVMKSNMLAIESAVRGGFDPMTAVAAVNAGDLTRLKHTGLYSVQLQPPMPEGPPEPEPEPESPPEEEPADE